MIDTYQTHGRSHEGDTEATLDTIYRAWREDRAFGRSSLMIAQTHKTVAALNTRARQDRVQAGHVDPAKTARLHDHTVASVGDVVITRRNNRRLQAGHGWVKNGDRWTITTIHNDASITARRENPIGPAVRLPAEYVAEHVELGYAVTAHRAQGVTVDTAHVLADPGMTRETLYVAMTRGRHANTAYVMTDHPDTEPHQQADTNPVNARSILHGIVSRSSAEQSAHQAIRSEQQHWTTIAQLAAEYETIAAAAQHDRWTTFIHDSGLTKAQADAVVTSDAFGPLTAALRRTEAHHHDVTHLLPQLVAAAPVRDAHDIASVLHYRLAKFLAQRNNTTRPLPPQLIAGLIPQAVGPMTTEMRKALDQRKSLIDHRATRLLEQMLIDNEPWIRSLREPPQDPRHRQDWLVDVRTIAAYRDRHQITTDGPLGRPDRGPSEATGAAYAGAGLSRVRRRQQASVDDEHLRRHAARPPNRSM